MGLRLEGEGVEYFGCNENKVWSILTVFAVLLN